MKVLWENLFKHWYTQDNLSKALLKKIPVFHQLSDKEIKDIENICHERRYKSKETVFKKNAPGEGMFIIISGNIKIYSTDSNGHEIVLANLVSGEFFGELSLLDSDTRSATAIANSDCHLLAFLRPDLQSLSKRNPQIGNKILFNLAKIIALRLRKTSNQLIETSPKLV